jgi:hypothetical protein
MRITLLLIIGEHDSDTVAKRKVVPRDVEPVAVLVGPGCADAGPDFLAGLVFAGPLAVVEDVCGGIRRSVNVWCRDQRAKEKKASPEHYFG